MASSDDPKGSSRSFESDDGKPAEVPTREEWLEFFSDEIGIRDRRMYWTAGILAILVSGCYYLATRIDGGGIAILDPKITAPLALGLFLGLWVNNQFFSRFREAIRPPRAYISSIDAQVIPFIRLLSNGRLPFALALRQALYAAAFGAVAGLTWLLRGSGWSLETIILTVWVVLLALGAAVFAFISIAALLNATGIAQGPNHAAAWAFVFLIDTWLPKEILTEEAEGSLRATVDQINAPDIVKMFMVLLNETGTGSYLGLPTKAETRSWKHRLLSGVLVVPWGLFVAFVWLLGRDLISIGTPTVSYMVLGLGFLLPLTVRVALELVQNPGRKLLEQLRLAVLHGRLTDEETVFAYMTVLSSEELGWWSPPALMDLLIQSGIISQQRYLEALTYPRFPRHSVAVLKGQSEEDGETGD